MNHIRKIDRYLLIFGILIISVCGAYADGDIFPFTLHKVRSSDTISKIIKRYNIKGERLDILEHLNPGLFVKKGNKKIAYLKKFKLIKIPFIKKVKKNHYHVSAGLFFGTYQEEINNKQRISQEQNALYTLGASFRHYYEATNNSLNMSLNFTQFNASKKSDQSSAKPKPEISLAIHHILHGLLLTEFSPYYGLEVERFNTFNSEELLADTENHIEYYQHKSLYMTIGSQIKLDFIEEKSTIRIAYSYTGLSKTSGPSEYKGSKYAITYRHNLYEDYFIELFHRGYNLEGTGSLNTKRNGFNLTHYF